MENRIKEQQLDLFADRTSCHDMYANQFRILLSGMAYILIEPIRRLALTGTEMSTIKDKSSNHKKYQTCKLFNV